MHGSGISSNCLWHHMAYAQFVIINMLLGFSAYSLLACSSLSLSLPASLFFFLLFLTSCQLVKQFITPFPAFRCAIAVVVVAVASSFRRRAMPTHHIMIYSCPLGLSCRLLFRLFLLFAYIVYIFFQKIKFRRIVCLTQHTHTHTHQFFSCASRLGFQCVVDATHN